MSKLNFIQIVVGQDDVKVQSTHGYRYALRSRLYALDTDGKVWELIGGGWQRITDEEAG